LKSDQFNKYAFSDPTSPLSKGEKKDEDIPMTQERIAQMNRMIQGIAPKRLQKIASQCAGQGNSAYSKKIRRLMFQGSQF